MLICLADSYSIPSQIIISTYPCHFLMLLDILGLLRQVLRFEFVKLAFNPFEQ